MVIIMMLAPEKYVHTQNAYTMYIIHTLYLQYFELLVMVSHRSDIKNCCYNAYFYFKMFCIFFEESPAISNKLTKVIQTRPFFTLPLRWWLNTEVLHFL